jgi:basic amino acid/polyamine antiporter, APA family
MSETDTNKPAEMKKELSLLDATMLVMGSMIGSGVFIVTADVARYVGGAGWVLVVWLICAMVTLIGALSYGELAGMMPKVGGQFVYLKEAYGSLVAFLFGWCTFLVIQTGTIAAVAVAFARYTGVLVPFFDEKNILLRIGDWEVSATQLLAVASIVLLTLVNLRGVKEAKIVQLILTLTKSIALAAIILLGIWVGLGQQNMLANWATAWQSYSTEIITNKLTVNKVSGFAFISVIGLAMVGPLFSSSAWNNITYTAAEIKNPKRDIPLSLFWGTLLVSILYILANVAYMLLLPVAGLPDAATVQERGIMFALNDRVGTAAAEVIFGGMGTVIMAAFIMVSTFGCNNGLILSGSRVYYAMAQEGLFFKAASKLNTKGVPGVSIVGQSAWACALCLTGTYSKLLDYTVFTILIFYFLTILAVFVLRQKQPNTPRPYRAFGYPVVPALYLLFSVGMCVVLLLYKTYTSLAGLLIVAIGVGVYYVFLRGKRKA